jgi:putative membrane protein
MIWVKAVHVVAILLWSASLVYLPMIMATHRPKLSEGEYARVHGMSRLIYVWLASPIAIVAILSGSALVPLRDITEPWFALKLAVVSLMAFVHARCGLILAKQTHEAERANLAVRTMRIATPLALIPCVLWLVLAKPRIDFGEWPVTPLALRPVLQTPAFRPASLRQTPAAFPALTAGCRGDTRRLQHRIDV